MGLSLRVGEIQLVGAKNGDRSICCPGYLMIKKTKQNRMDIQMYHFESRFVKMSHIPE